MFTKQVAKQISLITLAQVSGREGGGGGGGGGGGEGRGGGRGMGGEGEIAWGK